jgi:hypothetical protein
MQPQSSTSPAKRQYNRAYYARNHERLDIQHKAYRAAHPLPPLPLQSLPGEQWRPVVRYEGWYEVSDLGRICRIRAGRGARAGRIRRPGRNTAGYLFVPLWRNRQGRNFLIHRLVLEAFVGPFEPGEQANHISGVKTDNRLVNLEKVTSVQNMKHAVAKGLCKPNRRGQPGLRGEHSPAAKLTAANVQMIRALAGTVRGVELAKRYGVSPSTIWLIVKRHNWAHLS